MFKETWNVAWTPSYNLHCDSIWRSPGTSSWHLPNALVGWLWLHFLCNEKIFGVSWSAMMSITWQADENNPNTLSAMLTLIQGTLSIEGPGLRTWLSINLGVWESLIRVVGLRLVVFESLLTARTYHHTQILYDHISWYNDNSRQMIFILQHDVLRWLLKLQIICRPNLAPRQFYATRLKDMRWKCAWAFCRLAALKLKARLESKI